LRKQDSKNPKAQDPKAQDPKGQDPKNIDIVNMTLEALRPLMVSAGIRKDYIVNVKKDVTEDTLLWLYAFVKGFIGPLKEAITLRPEHIWMSYKLHHTTGLAEQVIRERAERSVRISWYSRPYPLKCRKSHA
jgi:hypothetical protein